MLGITDVGTHQHKAIFDEHTEISDQKWVIAVKFFREIGVWPDHLGPPPGSTGCRVPEDLLECYGFAKNGRRSA